MPATLSQWTDSVRERNPRLHRGNSGEIVAAVPLQLSSTDSVKEAMAGTALVVWLEYLGLIGLAIAQTRQWLGKRRTRNSGAAEKSRYYELLAIFRDDRIDIHHRKSRKRAGAFIESFSLDQVRSYGSTPSGLAIATYLRIDDTDFHVHGWFERDLKAVLRSLDVSLQLT